jgi:YggT family protein
MSPTIRLLAQITSPVMRPLHRIIPLINGIDITPIPAMIILQLLIIIVANPIIVLGTALAAG